MTSPGAQGRGPAGGGWPGPRRPRGSRWCTWRAGAPPRTPQRATFPPKSLLATIALALAGLQVLLAVWIYRRLPRAGNPPRPVPVAHRVTGFVLLAVTVPVAVHCLIAYGVQLTSLRVAIIAGEGGRGRGGGWGVEEGRV